MPKGVTNPEIAHLRGLGEPMFFTFNVEPKSKILICHAAIMGTFIVPPWKNIHLCQPDDDPRLPHFIDYIIQNKMTTSAGMINGIAKLIQKHKEELAEIEKRIAAMNAKL